MKILLTRPGVQLVIAQLAILLSLTACSTSRPTATSSPPEIVIGSPTVGSPSPTPTVTGDPFAKGVDKAASATSLAQSAQTPEDWNLVLTQWQRAIAFMKAVPASSPNYAAAQKLLSSYQQALVRTQLQAKRGGASQVPIVARGGSAEDGTPLMAGSQPSANSDTAQAAATTAIATVKVLLQQQTDFFAKQKRFAPTLADLDSSIPADTPNYAYSTNVLPSKQVIATATAKQDNLPSYLGIMLSVKDDKNNDMAITAICATSKPSKTLPGAPQVVGKEIQCPSGATKV